MAATSQSNLLELATASDLATAKEVAGVSLNVPTQIDNFEETGKAPLEGWSLVSDAGQPEFGLAEGGQQNTAHSLRLNANTTGTNARVVKKIRVKPGTSYQLRGAVKTEGITPAQGVRGAFVAVLEIQKPKPVVTEPLTGTNDWVPFRLSFESGDRTEITLAAALGGGGSTTGTAWFDELSISDLGPSDQSIARPLAHVIAHLQSRANRAPQVSVTDPNLVVLTLGVVPDVMKYDHAELTVPAGRKARIVFKNTDHMQHNALVIKPGTLDKVGALADAMLSDPTALSRNYVPASPDVLFNAPLVNPGETFAIDFVAPSEPGRYPIICTFPGHWRIMQSTLVVSAQ